tara:strand:- start:1612 stop:3690 length:2079 start_codon:yes stop_codon:yes gene_type:complete
MGWAALGKAAMGAVKGKAKKIATDKLLNRKKNVKNRRAKAQEAMGGGGEEQGGQLMIRPSTSLVPSGPSGIIPAPATDTGGGGGDTSTVEGTLMAIQTKVIKVENLLKGSNAVKEKMREDARQAAKDDEDKKQEKDLEKKQPKKEGKGKFKMPKVPGTGIFGAIWKFISTIVLGRLFMILFDHLPKLLPILGVAAKIADGLIGFIGWIGNIAMTIIDWGYKLVGAVSNWVGETFGENVQKGFDMFLGVIKDLIAAFLVWKIWAQKAVTAAIEAVKRAFRIARVIVKRAIRFAKNAIKFAKNIAAKAGKLLMKIPGVKNVVGKVAQFGGKILGAGKNLLGMGKGVAGKAAGKIGGFAAKLFGKAAKFIAPAMKSAKPFVSKFFGRIPIIGPLVVGIVSIISGDPPGKALFKTIGAALGGFLGTFIPIPILGTILGETIGVFVGDMLYTLLFGGGLQAVGQNLKAAIGKILSGGKKVLDWIGAGFSRFYEGIPKFKIPDFPKDPPKWIPGWVPMKGKIWNVFKGGIKILIGPLSLLMGKEIPILPWLLNPMNTGPLLLKSFFPPSGEGGSSSEKDEKKEEDKLKIDDKSKEKKKEEKKSSSIGEVIAKMFKDEGASDGKNLIATNQKNGAQGVIDSLKTKADYEEGSISEIKVNLPPPPVPTPMGGGSGEKEVVRVPVPVGAGGDPYEDLDFFG